MKGDLIPKGSTATKTEKSTEKRYLKCFLTEEEKRELATDMAQAVCQRDSLENNMESIKAQIKAEVKKTEAIISGNAEKIRAGYEMREVECEVMIDRDKNSVTALRLDTGEIIEERRLTFAERQISL